MIGEALRVMGIGVAGVFVVLTLFYIVITLMMKLMPPKDGKKE
ncbi:OadG family protein [Gehongia tenuis]|jgi:Na+-transporting methylmalonyl-CoA/oxaloacetate decarboxylase gamma subunit|uniref:OadG family protein n=1 Tax=Gehongia tenuis TaxID=2763655 RepID=A0A926D4H2_9FIRM|nr:OadG family protein [Gehongia tenuis]MBC8531279.1 OadG family protein [Gehongia tenuis]